MPHAGTGAEPGAQFLPLPTTSFQSFGEWSEFRRQHADLLAIRARHERSLGSMQRQIALQGTCGVCLRPAGFTAATEGGEWVQGGRMPQWRDTLGCDCASALTGTQRAALQFLFGTIGVQPWYKTLVLGVADSFAAAVEAVLPRMTLHQPRPRGTARPGLREILPGNHHVVVAIETLHRAESPADLLAAIAAALLPGGHLLLTVPFSADDARSDLIEDPHSTTPHRIGWDILQFARDAGFRGASAHLYWSEEFGYLGTSNFILTASR